MSHHHITRDQRVELGALLRAGHTKAEIARLLGKHRSTIGREMRRNTRAKRGRYHAKSAQYLATSRRLYGRRHSRRLVPEVSLTRYVEAALARAYSPEQIAGRLRFVLGETRLCHETIYRWIYLYRPDLKSYLHCTKGKYRRKRGTNSRWKKRELAKKKWIDERPDIVKTRSRIGDWEGDTVHGHRKSGYLATLVERKSGYLLARKLRSTGSEEMLVAVTDSLGCIPAGKRLTLTLDNGTEMAAHEELERRTGLSIYFAHPYHSWERGTNENTNGLLRFYFPKKASFAGLNQDEVDQVVWRLNTRPRKRLGYQSPHTVFHSRVAIQVRT